MATTQPQAQPENALKEAYPYLRGDTAFLEECPRCGAKDVETSAMSWTTVEDDGTHTYRPQCRECGLTPSWKRTDG